MTGADSYVVSYNSGTTRSRSQKSEEAGASTSHTIRGITPSTTSYYVIVAALPPQPNTNNIGGSESPIVVNPEPVVITTLPRPQNVREDSSSRTTTSFTVSWDAVTGATGYSVSHNPGTAYRSNTATTDNTTSNSYTVRNVDTTANDYWFQVSATSSRSNVNNSSPNGVSILRQSRATADPPALTKIAGLRSTATTDSSISLSWTAQDSATYEVRYCEASNCSWSTPLSVEINERVLTGLQPSTRYVIDVQAKRDSTNGGWLSSADRFRITTAPSPNSDPPDLSLIHI